MNYVYAFLNHIAVLATNDPDGGSSFSFAAQSFTYSIRNKKADLPFIISGANLQTTRMLDYENQTSWTLTIRSTDHGVPSLFIEKTFVINVTGLLFHIESNPLIFQSYSSLGVAIVVFVNSFSPSS